MKSYDILIKDASAGKEYPLLFGSRGGIRLGNAIKEPAQPGSVDSIVIESLHHGFGHSVAIDPATYLDANWNAGYSACDASVPGRVITGGLASVSPETTGATYITGFLGVFPGVALIWNNTVFVALDRDLFSIVAGDAVNTTNLIQLPAGERFTGSVVEWRGKLIFGVENDTGYSQEPVVTDGTPAGTTRPTNADLEHSWATSTRIGLFWIANRGGKSANAPLLFWTDRTDIDFGSLTSGQYYGPFYLEVPSRRVSGMGSVAVYPIFATEREELWGLDRDEVFFPLTHQGPGQEGAFGYRMLQWMGGLIAWNSRRIAYLDINTLELADIHPVLHQKAAPTAGSLNEGMRIRYVTVHDNEVFALVNYGTFVNPDSGQTVQHRIYRLVPSPDGLFWHPVARVDMMGTPSVTMVVFRDTIAKAGRLLHLFWAHWDAANSRYEIRRLRIRIPGPGHHPGPSSYHDNSTLITAYYPGRPPHVSKLPIRVRGYLEAPATVSNQRGSATLSLDVDGTVTNLGTVTGTGPFVLDVPNTVIPGRQMALRITLTPPSDDTRYYTALILPLSIDYVHVSRETEPDYITIEADVSSDDINKLGGGWIYQGQAQAEAINALTGKTVTVEFATSEITWTVLVEQVEVVQQRGETAHPLSDSYRIRILGRRL